jgi:RNA polymerase sigma-70 factor (ECF subfamily)
VTFCTTPAQIVGHRRHGDVAGLDDPVNHGRAEAASSFDALFRAYYRRLARILYRIVGQTDLAEELAAEAFWKLHQGRPAQLANAEGWLCRAGVRLALDALRKGKRRAHYERAAPGPDAPRSPEDDFARGEEQERVRQVLARMKPSDATLLMLRAEGLSYQELATTLQLHSASVGTKLARAEGKFKREYEHRHGTATTATGGPRERRQLWLKNHDERECS